MRSRDAGSVAPRGRGDTTARLLAWSLLALAIAATAAGMVLENVTGGGDPEESLFEGIALLAAFMAFPVVGALIASRHPGNAVGWIFLGIGVTVGLLLVAAGYARYALVLHPGRDLPGATLAAWVEGWVWMPLIGTIPTLLFLLFPTGRPPSRRWRPVAWLAGAEIALVSVLSMTEEKLVGYGYSIPNPIGIQGLGDVEKIPILLLPFFPLALLCASSLIFRYRSAHSEERQQLKWVAVFAVLFAVGVMAEDIFKLPNILFSLLLGALPASVGIAILRYRLYDIDLVINRTLVYGSLTALLAASYFGIVVLLQGIVPGADDSDLAVAGSTLAVAALFRPARSRIQGFIDRRFYRHKYDASRTLERFSSRLRDEVDLETLSADLLGVVRETMQPKHASLWLQIPRVRATATGGES
jgi:hypothetical protein